jgi:hypothetical protein
MIKEFEDYVKIGGVGNLIQNVSSISRFGIRFTYNQALENRINPTSTLKPNLFFFN